MQLLLRFYVSGTALVLEDPNSYPQIHIVMKKLIFTTVLALLFMAAGASKAQDYPEEYLGLPGDNLNLYAVMDLFRESATLEAFERSLNSSEKIINNLDLNNDNYVDYIIVKDYVDGSVHTIVLSVAMNNNEFQDVAVFTVEQFRDGSVQIQLIGDEALYGKNYIIEPVYAETPNPGYKGNAKVKGHPKGTTVVTTTYVQVAAWPVVRYIYTPTYVVYHSPWYWGYYPSYWARWTPHYWHYYYGYHYHWHSHYYSYYRPWPHHRYSRYHTFYHTSFRHTSPRVASYVTEGRYRSTYSRPDELSRGKNQYHSVHGSRTSNAQGAASGRNEVSPRTTGHPGSSGTVNTPRTHRESQNAVRPATTPASPRNASVADRPASTSTPATREKGNAVRGGSGTSPQAASPAVRNSSNAGQQSPPASVRSSANTRQNTPANVRSSGNTRQEPTAATVRSGSSTRQPAPSTNVRAGSDTRSQSSQGAVRSSSPSGRTESSTTVNRPSSSNNSSRGNVSTPSSSGSRGASATSTPSRGSNSASRSSSSSGGSAPSGHNRSR
jgi:hypothetical protein